MESGSENRESGAGAALEDPLKRLVISAIKPPSPAMPPSPPVKALASPPEAVCESRFCHPLLPAELGVLLLEGFPN
jgi:hypothetical protein